LTKSLFSHSYVFSNGLQLIVNQLYHKTNIIWKKGATCKKKQGDFNFAYGQRRATSADTGQEFRPLRLVW
jgi:hypothetical protein